MTVEQRMDQLEKRNKRLTIALTMMAVAMCAMVTMAAKYRVEKEGLFEMVATRQINVMNDAGKVVVTLSANDDGNGMIRTRSAKGNDLVDLTSTEGGNGTVRTFQPNGKKLVMLGSTDNGGGVVVLNKTGEMIAEIKADDYGNGVVWAGNRKGKGRTLQPGP
jgi:hypothetical protein